MRRVHDDVCVGRYQHCLHNYRESGRSVPPVLRGLTADGASSATPFGRQNPSTAIDGMDEVASRSPPARSKLDPPQAPWGDPASEGPDYPIREVTCRLTAKPSVEAPCENRLTGSAVAPAMAFIRRRHAIAGSRWLQLWHHADLVRSHPRPDHQPAPLEGREVGGRTSHPSLTRRGHEAHGPWDERRSDFRDD